MSKSKQLQHLPFNIKITQLTSGTIKQERPADSELLQTQIQIHLKNQSDDQSIFEQSIVRLRGKKNKSILSAQIQNLKKENGILTLKNQEFRKKVDETALSLKQKQIEYKHNQTAITDLNTAFRASQKRKSVLQLQLSKLYNQLESNREQVQNYEKQINRLLNLHTSKDSELIDLMHRHSQEIKDLKSEHKSVIQEYELKQEETKKLLKKLNGINQQKQEKFREEIETYKASHARAVNQLGQRSDIINKLESQNEILQSYIKNNTDKYQSDLLTMKGESDRMVRQLRQTKEKQIRQITQHFQRDITSQKYQVQKLKEKLESQQSIWRSKLDDRESSNRSLTQEYHKKQKQYQNIIASKQNQINQLSHQNSKMKDMIEKEQFNGQELSIKNQMLENSLKEIYETTLSLESKILHLSKQKTISVNQNETMKREIEQLQSTKFTLDRRLTTSQNDKNQVSRKCKQACELIEKLENQVKFHKNSLKVLESEYNQLTQIHTRQNKNNSQLRDLLIEHQNNNQMLKDKCIKLQIFIDNLKLSSQKNRERTEKKWEELREVYQKQLQDLEAKVIESQKKYNVLKLRLEKVQRDNKIYQFQNTISPNIQSSLSFYSRK